MPNTPNHNANLPTVGADDSTWGTENNGTHNFWDALLSGAQNTILGRVASGSGPMKQLSQAEATSALAAMVGDSGSGGTKGMVPAPASGDAAARKTLGAGATWITPDIRALGRFDGTTGATVDARGVSVSRTGTGLYTVTLSPAMADADYLIQVHVETTFLTAGQPSINTKTASGFNIDTRRNNPSGTESDPYDPTFLSIVILAV